MGGLANLTLSATATGTAGNSPSGGIRVQGRSRFIMSLFGTFVATVAVERSIDGGSTFRTVQSFTNTDAPTSQIGEEPNQDGALYRFNVTAYTSGTVQGSLDQ